MKANLAMTLALAVAVTACGDDSTGPDGTSDNRMSGTVGGQPFEPTAFSVQGVYSAGTGLLTVSGSQTTGGVTTMVSITLLGVDGPGDYTLSPSFAGQFGQISKTTGVGGTTSAWSTVLAPGTGSVELTTINADEATGFFQFTGQASPGTAATGQLSVTTGEFHVEF